MAQKSAGTSAMAVAAIMVGGILAWSGLRGWKISEVARDFLGGKNVFTDEKLDKMKLTNPVGELIWEMFHAIAPNIFKFGGSDTGSPDSSTGGAAGGAAGSGLGLGSIPASTHPQENFKYAQFLAGQFGWNNQTELDAWYRLGMNESGWRNTAQNPTSTAYGIGQFLNSTWAKYGPKTSDPYLQTLYMAEYIRDRYGSPSAALAAWNSRSPHWY